MEHSRRIERDQLNAQRASEAATTELKKHREFHPDGDFARGVPVPQLVIAQQIGERAVSLRAIAARPFDAMVEAEVTTDRSRIVLWYANSDTLVNEVLHHVDGDVDVLSWTHPGFQLAISGRLGEVQEIARRGYCLRDVKAIARARFRQVSPTIAGLYDPGGVVDGAGIAARKPEFGLKSVKLDMTPEQVAAFISRMRGVLMVTGAPGTGKTTVAFQRIRFLVDQQQFRDPEDLLVPYGPALTKVFLANANLVDYSRRLLTDELGVPGDVVALVPDFVAEYLDRVWFQPLNARPRTRKATQEERRGREAFFSLCKVRDLRGMWETVESQARTRLAGAASADWATATAKKSGEAAEATAKLVQALSVVPKRESPDPGGSALRMDAVYSRVRGPYTLLRQALPEKPREAFDTQFGRWLFWVFDPLDVMKSYFSAHRQDGTARIKGGTAGRVRPRNVIDDILGDWEKRQYFPEESGWIAWVLRFVLPEETEDKFREVPCAIPDTTHATQRRWTHVVIDEAQDLAVQEASLLGSLVDPKGALTVSADFHQIVSPVHGMIDAEGLKFGLPIWDQNLYTQFPFQKNLRQSREIGSFLVEFFAKAFQEFPSFEAGNREEGTRPTLYTGKTKTFSRLIKQMVSVLNNSATIRSVALLQIDEDLEALERIRRQLASDGVSLADINELAAERRLITTSVERAKGLEFDACIVLGLDAIDRSSLNFAKNRAYVALSRPTQRLFMLCEHFPPLLQQVRRDLFEHHPVH